MTFEPNVAELLRRNAEYADGFAGGLNAAPALRLAIVACMDARIDIYAVLGIANGEAHIIRNAGGVVTDDVIRSLCISQQRLGTNEVAVIHHTRCGMEGLDEEAFTEQLHAITGSSPPWPIGSFTNVEDDVRNSIAALKESPFLAFDDAITGYVYDVDSGALTVVE